MKLKLIVISVCWCVVQIAYSQSKKQSGVTSRDSKSNAIYTEAYIIKPSQHDFGYPSINYERYFCCVPGVSMRIGATSDFKSHFALPITINYLSHQQSNHHLEVGMGAIISYNEKSDYYYNQVNAFALFLPLMYRYQQNDGILLRAGINSFFGRTCFVAPSVSVGFRF